MLWSAKFSAPIPLPDGGQLLTVEDARKFLNELRGYESNAVEWQAAIAAVLLAGEAGGATDLARAAIVEALRRRDRMSSSYQPQEALSGEQSR